MSTESQHGQKSTGLSICYTTIIIILTGQVDLVKEVVGLRNVIKGHTKHRLLGGAERPVLLGLATDEHASKAHGTTPNHKLTSKKKHLLRGVTSFQGFSSD